MDHKDTLQVFQKERKVQRELGTFNANALLPCAWGNRTTISVVITKVLLILFRKVKSVCSAASNIIVSVHIVHQC